MGFAIATLIVCMLAAWECVPLSGFTKRTQRTGLSLFCGLLLALLFFLMPGAATDARQPLVAGWLWISFGWWIAALLLVIYYPSSAVFWRHSRGLRLLSGLLTIVPFFWGMIVLRGWHYPENQYSGAQWLLYVMVLVWGADSGAYIFGKLFGKHKLMPKVSPGKPGRVLSVG